MVSEPVPAPVPAIDPVAFPPVEVAPPIEPEVVAVVEPLPIMEPVVSSPVEIAAVVGPIAVTPSFSVGATLRDGRERLGYDLPLVSNKLRIRQAFLLALEDGRYKDLPGGTYAIGFLRTYAEFLGLDGEEMVRRFRQEAADALAVHTELQFPSPVTEGRLPSAPVMLTGLAIAIVAYGLWWGVNYTHDAVSDLVPAIPERLSSLLKRPFEVGSPVPASQVEKSTAEQSPSEGPHESNPVPPAEEGVVKVLGEGGDVTPPSEDDGKPEAPAPTPKVSVIPADHAGPSAPVVPIPAPAVIPQPPARAAVASPPPSPSLPAIAPAPSSVIPAAADVWGTGRVVVRAVSDESWIQVRESDGQLVVSRLLHRGDSYTVPDRAGLTLTTGNAGTLQLTLDGKILPALGAAKEVKRNVSLDPAKLQKRFKLDAPSEPAADASVPAVAPASALAVKPDAAKAAPKHAAVPHVKKPVPAPTAEGTAPETAAPLPPAPGQ